MRTRQWLVAAAALVGLVGCGGPSRNYVEREVRVYQWTTPVHRTSPAPSAPLPNMDKPVGSDLAQAGVDRPGSPAASPAAPGSTGARATVAAPTSQPATAQEYVPYPRRRGPAYPGNFWYSFGRDGKEFAFMMGDDAKAVATNPWSLAGLAAAGASGIAIAASGADNKVDDHFTTHGHQLNTFWDSVGDAGGNPGTHFAVAGAMYFTTLAANDTKNYEVSKALLSALAINGLLTEGLKVAVDTNSPNGDPLGWPSGHMSSSVCLATVMAEAYGPWVGVPLFAFAGYVGYERIDARNHDFSDVISGAFIGLAIGHAVMQNHQPKVFGFEVIPWADPEKNAAGLAMTKRF